MKETVCTVRAWQICLHRCFKMSIISHNAYTAHKFPYGWWANMASVHKSIELEWIECPFPFKSALMNDNPTGQLHNRKEKEKVLKSSLIWLFKNLFISSEGTYLVALGTFFICCTVAPLDYIAAGRAATISSTTQLSHMWSSWWYVGLNLSAWCQMIGK